MQYNTHESDLYCLPETQKERNNLKSFLKTKNWGFQWCYSNVKGQGWEGKVFCDIPFCIDLKQDIINLFK